MVLFKTILNSDILASKDKKPTTRPRQKHLPDEVF